MINMSNNETVKIAISGATNCGKTTLIKDLSQRLNLPIVEEQFEALNDPTILKKPYENLMNRAYQIFDKKLLIEDEFEKGFITDRCPIDLFFFWCNHPAIVRSEQTLIFYNKCKKQCEKYDFLIIPPWGSVTYKHLESYIPGLSKPKMNPWINLRRHTGMMGLAFDWIPREKIIIPPQDLIDINKRSDWILEQISLSGD